MPTFSVPSYPMRNDISIRKMVVKDLPAVSQLGIASKASWGYPESWMRVFTQELTIDAQSLSELLDAQVACNLEGASQQDREEIVGYYTIRQHADGITELEHLFVHPNYFRQGIGSRLLRRAVESAAAAGVATLTIIADEHSADFYTRLGASRVGEHASSIPGRTIPILEFRSERLQ